MKKEVPKLSKNPTEKELQDYMKTILKLKEKASEYHEVVGAMTENLTKAGYEKREAKERVLVEYKGETFKPTVRDNQQEDGSILAFAYARRYSFNKGKALTSKKK